MMRSTRSSTSGAESRPTNSLIGSSVAGQPMTSAISSRVRTMFVKRRPSRESVSKGTRLLGLPETNGLCGGDS